MRTIFALFLTAPLGAHAAALPVTPGLEYCDAETWITAAGIESGPDTFCVADRPASMDGSVSLTCEHEGEAGVTWQVAAHIVENATAGTVVYSAGGQTTVLYRCE